MTHSRKYLQQDQETGDRVPLGESPRHTSAPVENPMGEAFGEYKEVPETVPLDFTEYDLK